MSTAEIRAWRDEALNTLALEYPPPFVQALALRIVTLCELLLSARNEC